ncbi:MAG TPA: TIGR03435 family protein [Bryobacteraceae bacterium]
MKQFSLIVAAMAALGPDQAQSQPPTPKFDVAAIRLSRDCDGDAGATKGVSPVGRVGPSSPEGLTITCATAMGLIQQAYVRYANGRLNQTDGSPPVSGGPSWIGSERYDITAKADGSASLETMLGPMMQALLEDRFRLRVRRETRQVAVYDLTVARNGPKLRPFKEGTCTPVTKYPVPPPEPGRPPNCNAMELMMKGPAAAVVDMQSRTLDDFSRILGRVLGRLVINNTGIPGNYDFHLEFAPDEATPGMGIRTAPSDDPAVGPSIFSAVQEQLGLKLESGKGPGEFLVIESVERPSGN